MNNLLILIDIEQKLCNHIDKLSSRDNLLYY